MGAGLPASAPASEAGDLEFAAGVGSSNEAWLDQSTSSRSTARVQPSPLAQRSANTHLQASFDTDDTGSISEPPQLQSREAKRLASPLILPLARLRTDMPELLRREGVDLTAKERHLSGMFLRRWGSCAMGDVLLACKTLQNSSRIPCSHSIVVRQLKTFRRPWHAPALNFTPCHSGDSSRRRSWRVFSNR